MYLYISLKVPNFFCFHAIINYYECKLVINNIIILYYLQYYYNYYTIYDWC